MMTAVIAISLEPLSADLAATLTAVVDVDAGIKRTGRPFGRPVPGSIVV
jgi:hypothetical protein